MEGNTGWSRATQHEERAAVGMEWYDFLEDSCASWAEQAQGYRLMHEKAFLHYSKISFNLTIPAIILSTLTGVANFGQGSLSPVFGSNVSLYIGVLSIAAAMLSTVAKYIRADEKAETHRNAMIMWDKLYRTIVTELTQPRAHRSDAQEFLISYREERHRLSEQSPTIPYKIRAWFKQHYKADYDTGLISPPNILHISNVEPYKGQRHTKDRALRPVVQLALAQQNDVKSDRTQARPPMPQSVSLAKPYVVTQQQRPTGRSPFKSLGTSSSSPYMQQMPVTNYVVHRDAGAIQVDVDVPRTAAIAPPPVLEHINDESIAAEHVVLLPFAVPQSRAVEGNEDDVDTAASKPESDDI